MGRGCLHSPAFAASLLKNPISPQAGEKGNAVWSHPDQEISLEVSTGLPGGGAKCPRAVAQDRRVWRPDTRTQRAALWEGSTPHFFLPIEHCLHAKHHGLTPSISFGLPSTCTYERMERLLRMVKTLVQGCTGLPHFQDLSTLSSLQTLCCPRCPCC